MNIVKAYGHTSVSLGNSTLHLETSGMTIKKMLRMLSDRMIDDQVPFSRENLLIAINGVEISALNGDKTVIEDGDTISLIPVSHGG